MNLEEETPNSSHPHEFNPELTRRKFVFLNCEPLNHIKLMQAKQHPSVFHNETVKLNQQPVKNPTA